MSEVKELNKKRAEAMREGKNDYQLEKICFDHILEQFGKALIKAREEKKMTKKELASKLNITSYKITGIEKGLVDPTYTVIIKLHELFGEFFIPEID